MNNYNDLDLNIVKGMVASHCSFSMSKDFIINEEVSFNPLLIHDKLKRVNEALELIKIQGRYSFEEVKDISTLLQNVKKGLSLTARELSLVYLHNAEIKRIVRYFRNFDKLEYLCDYLDSLYYNDALMNAINNAIDYNGDVKKDASKKLEALYLRLSEVDESINFKAKEFMRNNALSLQEAVIYNRNNRACFLVKNGDKNKFDGFIYGTSASGQACYVEPRLLIDLNNQKNDILEDIKTEIDRILVDLSIKTAAYSDNFIYNLESLMLLDAIFAKAEFGYERDGVLASVGGEDLVLKTIAHPLIDKKKVVYNTYRIEKPYKSIIISGSNTGGKTVSLKLIGLSILMSYLAIPLFAEEANIPMYDKILIDIDDNQSIIDSLSTFSSRLVALNRILKEASERSMVLIDEIASGTDPKEGEALALAIIEDLREKGASFVITTHFSNIKKYALNAEDILLSSQLFDTNKMLPTYKYLENSLGQSNALEIAKRYIDSSTIIDKAKTILKSYESKEEQLLKTLEIERANLEHLKAELEAKLVAQNTLNEELKAQVLNYQKNEERMKAELDEKLNAYYESQKEKADEIIKQLKAEGLKQHEAIKLASQLKELEEDDSLEEADESLELNDTVKINSTGQVGKIIAINKDRVTVDVNGISLKTKLNNLTKTKAVKAKKSKYVARSFKRANREIVLVGMHIDEGLDALSKYLDDAYGANMTTCKVVTGCGTGALRKAVWEYLKKCKNVKDFHYADAYDGGSAATIVNFK